MDIEAIKAVHPGREVIYSLFYRTFIMTPDEDLYKMLDDLLGFMKQSAEGDAKLEAAIEAIESFRTARALADDRAEYDLDTQRQYTRLFCMTNSVRTAQSHYSSSERLSRDEPYAQCIDIYVEYGFPKDDRYEEDADFIAEQLRFMSFMASLSQKALESQDKTAYNNYINAQIRFIDDHLSWLSQFEAELNMFEESKRLYAPLCAYIRGFIGIDREFLQDCLI